MRKEKLLFVRYLISGGTSAAAHFAVLVFLVEAGGINATFSSAMGFCVAILVNYSLQYHWTFRAKTAHRVAFFRYVTVTLGMLGINTVIFWLLNDLLSAPYLLAQLFATTAVVSINFSINRAYTFAVAVPK